MSHDTSSCSGSCFLVHRFATLFTAFLVSICPAAFPDATPPDASPFVQFRERTLEYAGPEASQAKPGGARPDEVGIGWFGPFDQPSHPQAGLWWAAGLAVQEANAFGGCRGRPFRLLPCWTENPWGAGARQLARLVYDEQPWAILGSIDGPSTHLAEQIVAKARLSLVSPVSTDVSVNLAGVPWMFSCAPGDDQLARLIARQMLADDPDPEFPAVLISATDHDSRMATRYLLRALSDLKRSPRFSFEFDPAKPDFHPQLEALKKAEPRALIISAGPEPAARLVQALRQARIQCTVYGTAPLGRRQFLHLAGPAAEGVRVPMLYPPREPTERTRSFARRFKAEFKADPDYAEAFTYDAATLLLEAIRSTTLNRARIRLALSEGSPWKGISGPMIWDGTGQNIRPVTRMGIVTQGVINELSTPGEE